MTFIFGYTLSSCAPLTKQTTPEVTRYEFEQLPDNAYRFIYELSDGQFREESGYFKKQGDERILVVSGSYGWKDTDGKQYRVFYVSDENGYRATGESKSQDLLICQK